ncbi:MAG: hypothetical protein ABIJ97_08250 [Bacteroidota bacterium]
MIKSILIVSFYILIITTIHGQNYIEYYNLCNEGDKQIYLENYQEALAKYEEAFSLVDYVHAKQYKSASICTAKLIDYGKTSQYAAKAILNGFPDEFLKDKIFKDFRKSKYYRVLRDSLPSLKNLHQKSVNLSYQKEVDSLYYIDQRIVLGNKHVKGNFNIDQSALPIKNAEIDSLIFKHLLELIDKYGFPSEKTIGYEGYANVWVLFLHNVRLPQNEKYITLLEEALINGEYQPSNYAWMYDQSMMRKDQEPMFYYGMPTTYDFSDSEKQKIDEIRRQYGIKPIESIKIETFKNGDIRHTPLW